jgi:hypothetical protein
MIPIIERRAHLELDVEVLEDDWLKADILKARALLKLFRDLETAGVL